MFMMIWNESFVNIVRALIKKEVTIKTFWRELSLIGERGNGEQTASILDLINQ